MRQGEQSTLSRPSLSARVAAWMVHALTASGAVLGMLAIVELYEKDYVYFFFMLILATLIDACDGALARWFQVKIVLPNFDGALLDNIVDYFTYVLVPALFLFESGVLPAGSEFIVMTVMALSSGYQFCQSDAKTEDHYFKGWPSYWNIVALYFFLLDTPPIMNFGIVLICGVLVFVPIKYLYPSRTKRYRGVTLGLTAVWGGLLLVALLQYPAGGRALVWCSLIYVVFYVVVSIRMTFATKPA